MIYFIIATLVALTAFLLYISTVDAPQIIISRINGFMVGGLYDCEEIEGYDCHTVQFLVAIIAFTFTWETQTNE